MRQCRLIFGCCKWESQLTKVWEEGYSIVLIWTIQSAVSRKLWRWTSQTGRREEHYQSWKLHLTQPKLDFLPQTSVCRFSLPWHDHDKWQKKSGEICRDLVYGAKVLSSGMTFHVGPKVCTSAFINKRFSWALAKYACHWKEHIRWKTFEWACERWVVPPYPFILPLSHLLSSPFSPSDSLSPACRLTQGFSP